MRRLFLLFFLMSFALPAMAKDADRADLAQSIITGHIIPGYEALAVQSQRLRGKSHYMS